MHRFNVRQKIQLPIILFIAVLSLFMFLYFPYEHKNALRESMAAEVHSLTQMVGNGVTIGLNNQDWAGIRSAIEFVQQSEDVLFVALVDDKGATFAADPENFVYSPESVNTDSLVVATRRIETELFTGLVVVGSSTRSIDQQVRNLRTTTFFAALITMVLGIFFGIWQSRLIVRPLSLLRLAAIKVEQGDLDTMVERRSNDEIGDLASEFSKMITSVRLAQECVQDANDELQSKNRLLDAERRQLARALGHLRATQAQLVQSEKMAALGQLIAGIAHEINTPLGAIRASISNIDKALVHTLRQLPELLSLLTPDQQQSFFALAAKGLAASAHISLQEQRTLRRELQGRIENAGFAHADEIADGLADMSLFVGWEEFDSLLRHPEVRRILQVGSRLVQQQRNSRNIETAVERASKIVFALKNFSRHDPSGSMSRAVITDGIDTVLTLYHNQLKQGIEVVRDFEEIPPVYCYPDELNQVWTNLIHNAMYAMRDQGRLEISVRQAGDCIETRISDSGHGIEEEIRDKIFDPFFTTKEPGQGTGLGLDIVRRIVEKHLGSVTFESIPGKTTFIVRIPRQRDPGETDEAQLQHTLP
jgi:signal transduction histidine kinase